MLVQRFFGWVLIVIASLGWVSDAVAQLEPIGPFPEKIENAVQPGANRSMLQPILSGPDSIAASPAPPTVSSHPAHSQGTNKANIVVHPPRSSGSNAFSFLVENLGAVQSPPFTVEIATPPGIEVASVVPLNAHTSPNGIQVDFPGLTAGKVEMIYLQTNHAPNAGFVTRVHTHRTHADQLAQPNPGLNAVQSAIVAAQPPVTSPFRFASSGKMVVADRSGPDAGADSAFQRHPSQKVTSAESSLMVSISGKQWVSIEQTEGYEIQIANAATREVRNIIVQLKLPSGMTITELDRKAWMNQKKRTVSWRIDSMGPGQVETIEYSLKALVPGAQIQRVTVGASNRFEDTAELHCGVKQ